MYYDRHSKGKHKFLLLEIFRVIKFFIRALQAGFFVWLNTQKSVCNYRHLSFFISLHSLLHCTQNCNDVCYCSSVYKNCGNLDLGFLVKQ